jgi:hypothetical protein
MQYAREVNDAIADLGRRFQVQAEGLDFFCECSAEDCLERLPLTLDVYDGCRADSRPLLVEGHLLARAADAIAHAEDLIDSAAALQAQSAHQIARARRRGTRSAARGSE